jgi:hypothetical protein
MRFSYFVNSGNVFSDYADFRRISHAVSGWRVADSTGLSRGEDMAQLSFTEHPASVGETYGEHFATALYFGGRLMAASLACVVHAVLPFLFTRTASRTIADLHTQMVGNRVRPPHGGFYQPNFEI